MKKIILALVVGCFASTSFASSLVCSDHKQTFLFRKGTDSLYTVYECDKNLQNCSMPVVFEALGFFQENSFKLVGRRVTGQRVTFDLIKARGGWSASLKNTQTQGLLSLLSCKPYVK